MPSRLTPLASGEYYHVFNRGVAYQPTYSFRKDYERFLLCLSYYRFQDVPFKLSKLLKIEKDKRETILSELESGNKLIDLIAFCLMPNHFHILLKQISERGTSKFMKKIADSYTRYFNTKYERVGPLFQGAFKVVHVANDEQLLHLSRYIHLNPLVSYVVREKSFLAYPWTSLQHFVNGNSGLVNIKLVLDYFPSPGHYLKFVLDQADYGKELERIKHLTLEK